MEDKIERNLIKKHLEIVNKASRQYYAESGKVSGSMFLAVKKMLGEFGDKFIMPSDEELINLAILINEGKLEQEKLKWMVTMCKFVLHRLHENGNIKEPSSIE